MILEGIVTTRNPAGELNVAPMGPVVDEGLTTLLLRPFQSAQTYRNLKQHPEGVFHVVDDVLLLARAAIGRLTEEPATSDAAVVAGRVLRSCCRWFEFRVDELDDSEERTRIRCQVVHSGRVRDFFGLNRAKHAVVEAAILATRVHILPPEEIRQQFEPLRIIVGKTAGPREVEAFDLLDQYVTEQLRSRRESVRTGSDAVSVSTGARLHFGLLAHRPATGREAGGIGCMIDSPGWSMTVRECDAESITVSDAVVKQSPDSAERIRSLLGRLREKNDQFCAPVSISVSSAIPAHAGLGSGTQLAFALTSALNRLRDAEPLDAPELARLTGRGLRSAIGAWGFHQGGFLVDGGKLDPNGLAPPVARVEMPKEWRYVLVAFGDRPGLSGAAEQTAFKSLPPTSQATTDRLCRIVMMELLPAIAERQFEAAAVALREYGQLVGEFFAPAQGGPFAEPIMMSLVPKLEDAGVSGIVQTSWGPTAAILCNSEEMAKELVSVIPGLPDSALPPARLAIVQPLNRGAFFT